MYSIPKHMWNDVMIHPSPWHIARQRASAPGASTPGASSAARAAAAGAAAAPTPAARTADLATWHHHGMMPMKLENILQPWVFLGNSQRAPPKGGKRPVMFVEKLRKKKEHVFCIEMDVFNLFRRIYQWLLYKLIYQWSRGP